MDASYSVPAPMETTPNTIPEKTESIKDETVKIDKTADVIESKQPQLQKEVQSIKLGTEKIRNKSDEIKSESVVHDLEKEKLTKDLQSLTNVVKQLQDAQAKEKAKRDFYLKVIIVGVFALAAVFFLWYGTSIPGTGYTMLGAVMAISSIGAVSIWNYLEENPLIITGAFVVIGIVALMMFLCKREKTNNPLGFE